MSCNDFKSTDYVAYLNYTTNFTLQTGIPGGNGKTRMLIVSIALSSFVIVTNSILIYALVKTSRPFSKATQMFLCLSFVDMLSVIMNMINLLFSYVPYGLCILKFILYMLSSSLFFLGINIFLSISILPILSILSGSQ